MPELPEVECLTRAVSATIDGFTCDGVDFYRDDIREPIPKKKLLQVLVGRKIERVYRRSKYLLIETQAGTAIVHLGMTGNLLAADGPEPRAKHTHVVFCFKKGSQKIYLQYVDPRRFGRISAATPAEFREHEWFTVLGPEPLDERGLGAHLFAASRKKSTPVKAFLMDPAVVVGVGNIYACESLFLSGINPLRKASALTAGEYDEIASAIKKVLKNAIKAGGTTFRDFRNSDGSSGYFRVELKVYDQAKNPCVKCGKDIKMERISGRSTFFCAFCQT
jgi:formamidopyrimidine-DNA glycosylase